MVRGTLLRLPLFRLPLMPFTSVRFVNEAIDQGHLSFGVASPHDCRKLLEESLLERARGIRLLPKCEVDI